MPSSLYEIEVGYVSLISVYAIETQNAKYRKNERKF
jgi:hypothetical protein